MNGTARIQNIADTESNWKTANPILLNGEIGFEIKANKQYAMKVGDGITAWNDLPYSTKTPAEIEEFYNSLQNLSSGTGITVKDGVVNHTNSIIPATMGDNSGTTEELSFGSAFNAPWAEYDSEGHITKTGSHRFKIPTLEKEDISNALGEVPMTNAEIENLISTAVSSISWKEAVATYDDIATTYPNPVEGWTVAVTDTGYTYRYDGSEWVIIKTETIPLATATAAGLMSPEDKNAISKNISDIANLQEDINDTNTNLSAVSIIAHSALDDVGKLMNTKANKDDLLSLGTAVSGIYTQLDSKVDVDDYNNMVQTLQDDDAELSKLIAANKLTANSANAKAENALEKVSTKVELSVFNKAIDNTYTKNEIDLKTMVDSELNLASTNAVQNRAVAQCINDDRGRIKACEESNILNQATLGYQKKNLLNNFYALGSAHSWGNVSWNTNSDRSITVKGTASSSTDYPIGKAYLTEGKYIFTTSSPMKLHLYNGTNTSIIQGWSVNSSQTITITESNNYVLRIFMSSGDTHDTTFYFMLRNADITDDTYEPYVESVDERLNALLARIEALENA